MRWFADFLYLIAGLLYLPVAVYQAATSGRHRSGWGQRFGFVPKFDPSVPRIWIHAVSLGEINATPRLVEGLQAKLPEVEVVISTTTDTGYARAVRLYGPDRVFRYPLDFSLIVGRVLRRVRPSMIVLVELEVWYNLVRMADRRGIPVAVVNGRLTARSHRRLAKIGSFGRAMFRPLAWVGAQDETIAGRFRSLGVHSGRVEVVSSLKWDSADVTATVAGADELRAALAIDSKRQLLVAGSTGPDEEAMLLEVYRQLLKTLGDSAPALAIVPRKPERFDEVARMIEQAGCACIRRSNHPDDQSASKPTIPTVVLGDTMGELRKFYSLADVVFVGRTLVPLGGSDPMEVAAIGKPIIVGPHYENFRAAVDAMEKAGGIRVVANADALASTIAELLSDKELAARQGASARNVVIANQGATAKTCQALAKLYAAVHGDR